MASTINSILRYSTIAENTVFANGKQIFNLPSQSFEQFADAAYHYFQVAYPKFHKMDNLSKLGFLTSEIMLKGLTLTSMFGNYKVGIVLSNKSASLDTDLKYSNALKKGVVSPAVFVYTLPNIVMGEICIKNSIKGENAFFVTDQYDIATQVDYVNSLLNEGIIDACVSGWVELMHENYKSFLYLTVKTEAQGTMPYTVKNIETMYSQIGN